jgi:hypothetical protein
MSNTNQEQPTPISTRTGCKVSWATYATEEEAKTAAKYAQLAAALRAAQGYDFGYLTPGAISRVQDGWEVVFP